MNISGIAIILQMRERMEQMQKEMGEFVQYIQKEMLGRFSHVSPAEGAIVPIRRTPVASATSPPKEKEKKGQ